jgi:hypothetical protein
MAAVGIMRQEYFVPFGPSDDYETDENIDIKVG